MPDLFVAQVGFSLNFLAAKVEQGVVWNNTIGPNTGGRVGSVDFGNKSVKSLWEVTVSSNFSRDLLPRAMKVAGWAKAGRAFNINAVLAMDRGVYFQLTPEQRQALVQTVTSSGGYISLFRDLKETTLKNSNTIANDLK